MPDWHMNMNLDNFSKAKEILVLNWRKCTAVLLSRLTLTTSSFTSSSAIKGSSHSSVALIDLIELRLQLSSLPISWHILIDTQESICEYTGFVFNPFEQGEL